MKQPLSRTIRLLLFPCLPLCIMLLHQQYQVHIHGLTSWKGGGMGMFSVINARVVFCKDSQGQYSNPELSDMFWAGRHEILPGATHPLAKTCGDHLLLHVSSYDPLTGQAIIERYE